MTQIRKNKNPNERQRRYFKAKVLKYNRKLNRIGQDATGKDFENIMIEGKALLLFTALDSMSRKSV